MDKQKTIFYENELTDDFATSVKSLKPLPSNYKYHSKNIFFGFFSWFTYRILFRPFAWVYLKLRFHHKFINKKCLKKVNTGYFVYINHTTLAGDAFMPNLLSIKRRNYILTGEQANSLTSILPLLTALGAIPLTENLTKKKEMIRVLKHRIKQKSSITIYPEAHVWPYYTDIRPFGKESFKYATKLNVPIFCMTNCYQKKKWGKRPKIVSYVDGPFYPKDELNSSENAAYLRDIAYSTMKQRAKNHSTYSYYNYVKKEKSN